MVSIDRMLPSPSPLSLSVSLPLSLIHTNIFHSFQGYCRLALSAKEMDTTTVNPQQEGVYNIENSRSVGLVAEGDTPTFNFLKRLMSVTTHTFNGVALTVMDMSDLQRDTVSSN